MKKIICFLLSFALMCGFGLTVFADNGDIALCNDNVMLTDTTFNIFSDGYAEIGVSFYGYIGITTGGTVSTLLEKKVNGEWTYVDDWFEEVSGDMFFTVYSMDLPRGHYRATVEYTVSGTGGPDDVITDKIERTY